MSATNATQRQQVVDNQTVYERRQLPKYGFETWLDDLHGIRRVYLVRASDTTKSRFESNLRASIPRWRGQPAVEELMERFGAQIVLPESEALRDSAGVYEVRMRDLPGGSVRTALIAYAIPVQDTLFLYVLNSAAKSVLEADREEDRGNPFTELLRATVRRLTYRLWEAAGFEAQLQLSIPQHTRLAREPSHAKAAWRTFKRYSVDLVIDGKHINVHSQSDEFVHHIFEGTSAKELTEIVTRLFKQKQAILASGNFYEHPGVLPFTHGPTRVRRTSDRQTWDEEDLHRLSPIEDAGGKLADLVRYALKTAADSPKGTIDWREVARHAGQTLQVESRLAVHRKRGGLAIHRTSGGGYDAIRRLLHPRYIEGWLTGRIYCDIKTPDGWDREATVIWDDDIPVVTDRKGVTRFRVPVDFPLPPITCSAGCSSTCPDACQEHMCRVDWHHAADGAHKSHGWPVTDGELQRLLELRRQPPGSKNQGGHDRRRLLAGITHDAKWRGYIDGDRQYRLSPKGTTRYQVEHRALPAGDPHQYGWDGGHPVHCTMAAGEWQKSVGEALEQALHDVSCQLAPLHRPAEAVPDDRPGDVLREDLAKAQAALTSAENRVTGATAMVAEARGKLAAALGEDERRDLQYDLSDTEEALAAARNDRAAARRRLDDVRRRRLERPAGPSTATAEVYTLAVLAKALQNAGPGTHERVWNDLITRHVSAESVRFDLVDQKAQVRWSMTFRVQDADTGAWLELPISGRVGNKVQKRQDGRINRTASAGELFFGAALPFDEVAAVLGTSSKRGQKNSQLWHRLHTFLAGHVPVAALRTALIDTPPELQPLRRVIYTLVTGQPVAGPPIANAYRQHIIDTYTSTSDVLPHAWGNHWVGSTHVHERTILAAIDRPELGISVTDAIKRTGIRRDDVLATARRRRNLQAAALANLPPRLERTWARTDRLSDDDRLLRPVACPHSDCPGRRRGRKSFCTVVLWTPETWADAVICPACSRTPSDATVTFPAPYLLPWRGRFGPDARSCGARGSDGTHLDPTFGVAGGVAA